eukprot:2199405-Pyramimonas_sp.AAC.1
MCIRDRFTRGSLWAQIAPLAPDLQQQRLLPDIPAQIISRSRSRPGRCRNVSRNSVLAWHWPHFRIGAALPSFSPSAGHFSGSESCFIVAPPIISPPPPSPGPP